MPAEHVLQRRRVDAVGMTSLLRLLELLRIAEQHDAVRRLRHGDDVRERHLSGFVDEEHVDRRLEFRSRPQPRRAADDIGLAGLQFASERSALSPTAISRSTCRPSCRRRRRLVRQTHVGARLSASSATASSKSRMTL